MAKFRSILVVALLLVWTATPALRCLIPGEILTPEEQACCKSMGGDCGDSPASDHPCCKKVVNHTPTALAAGGSNEVQLVVIASVPMIASGLALQPHPFVVHLFLDTSPPETPPASPAILRI